VIPDAKIAEIRERADIAEVIGEYVTLRRAGSNLKGICPFHPDTDPSFNVNPARQFFYCFGCGASGDIFGFVQRMEGIDFQESARQLAGRYGIELPKQPISSQARTQAERAREASLRRRHVLEQAALFFEAKLRSAQGSSARELLKSRGIDAQTTKKFRLGYAPDSWSSLIDHFAAQNVSQKELEVAGLVIERKGGGYYDRFRHRLMFTYMDPTGQPIAFSGRMIEKSDERQAKYMNSPETPEYTKGKVLFGLHQARVPLSKSGEAVLVEGNFDVVSLSQAGIENVVSPLGTALTAEQAGLLRRRVERVIVMFDGDDAGRAASARAFPILANAGLASYIVPLPNGEDPDSFVRRKGAGALMELLGRRAGLLDQIIHDSASACDGSAQDAARRIQGLRPLLGILKNMEADIYKEQIAVAFGVDRRTVFKWLRGSDLGDRASVKKKGDKELPGHVEERELLGLLLDFPEFYEEAAADGTLAMVFSPQLKALLAEIGNRMKRKESFVGDLVARANGCDTGSWLAERAMVRCYQDRDKARSALEEIRVKLKKTHLKKKIDELEKLIYLANSKGDDMRVLELSKEKAILQKEGTINLNKLFDVNTAKA
jgi:DNA primase